MRECTQCGHDLKETATHCDNCGAWQDPNPKKTPVAAAPVAAPAEAAVPAVATPKHQLVGGLFIIVGILMALATLVIQAGQSYDVMAIMTAVIGVIVIAIGLFIFFRGGKTN